MLLTPSTTAMFQKAGMLAPDGRCKTLSSAANGYVRADSCGMMFITSMDVQQYSMEICGTAVNQDGRSSSLTAPNGPAQQSVIRAALKQDALSPDDIGIMQMHGTGTPLGDPIEVGAISGVIGQARSMPVSLTASKSWAGHSEAGAGVVGLQHASHMVSESLLIEVLHLRNLNKYLSNAGSCWSAARQKSPSVEEGTSSVAGISAFAFQGTNAHSLVKQGSAIDSPVNPDVPWHHSICWIAGPVHSSLSSASSESDSLRFEAHLLRGKRGAYLMDHKVMNRILVPGAAFME
jgi:acyl transferase domain-containing protein